MNEIAPLSSRQKAYLARVKNSWFNVAEGGKRGGKNVLNTLAFCLALEQHPDKIHLCAGVSQSTASINILECDGYGLMNYFEGRCKEGKFKDRRCLYVQTITGEKIILIAGGRKSGDEAYIKGNTYGMAYITEANECHEKFIKEVFDRTISSSDRKIFHDLNPMPPNHWYYTEILDFHEKKQLENPDYGYNYGHFTIVDNMSISDQKLRNVLATYQKGTVWYDRDIKGLRKQAEGLIYPHYADHIQEYRVSKEQLPKLETINIGVDFGGNKSNHAMVATGIDSSYQKLYALKSWSLSAREQPVEYICRKYEQFRNQVVSEFGNVRYSFADSAEQAIINTMRGKFGTNAIQNSRKFPIIDRIRCTDVLISAHSLYIVDQDNEALENGLSSACWDNKKMEDIRLDDGTSDIDILDAFEYSFELYIPRLVRREKHG